MLYDKAILICLLIYMLIRTNKQEGFQSPEVINKQAHILHKNKSLFEPYTKYTDIKKKISWIDPVIYTDMFELSKKNKINIENIKNALYV
jgi:hypothetical protein